MAQWDSIFQLVMEHQLLLLDCRLVYERMNMEIVYCKIIIYIWYVLFYIIFCFYYMTQYAFCLEYFYVIVYFNWKVHAHEGNKHTDCYFSYFEIFLKNCYSWIFIKIEFLYWTCKFYFFFPSCWLSVYESVVWWLVGPIAAMSVINLLILFVSVKAAFTLKEHVLGFGNLRWVFLILELFFLFRWINEKNSVDVKWPYISEKAGRKR